MDYPSAHVRQQSLGTTGIGHPLAKACDQCHRCKVACDGDKPLCRRCVRNQSACTYSLGKHTGKPRKKRSRVEVELSEVPESGFAKDSEATLGFTEGSVPHKRKRSSAFSENSSTSIGQLDLPEMTLCSVATCSSEQTSYDPERPTNEVPYFDSDLHESELLEFASSNLALDDLSFQITTPIHIRNSDLGLGDRCQVATIAVSANDIAVPYHAQSCNCVSEVLDSISAMTKSRNPMSLDGIIYGARKAQSSISTLLDCSINSHNELSSLLACNLLLLQAVASFKAISGDMAVQSAVASFSIKVCGLEVSIGESDIRESLVEAVMSTQIHDTLSTCEKLRKSAHGLPEHEASALQITLGAVNKDLTSLLPRSANA